MWNSVCSRSFAQLIAWIPILASMAYGLEGGGYTWRSYVWCAREGSIPLGGDSPRGVLAMGLYFSFSNCLLELRISQIFPRAGVQRDYPDGEMIFFGGNNVGLPLVLNSLRVKKKKDITEFTVHNFHQFENVEWNKIIKLRHAIACNVTEGRHTVQLLCEMLQK